MIELLIIRHAHYVIETGKTHKESHLTLLGYEQCEQLSNKIKAVNQTYDLGFCSNLQRGQDTLKTLQSHGIVMHSTHVYGYESMNNGQELIDYLNAHVKDGQKVIWVGHNPVLEELYYQLSGNIIGLGHCQGAYFTFVDTIAAKSAKLIADIHL